MNRRNFNMDTFAIHRLHVFVRGLYNPAGSESPRESVLKMKNCFPKQESTIFDFGKDLDRVDIHRTSTDSLYFIFPDVDVMNKFKLCVSKILVGGASSRLTIEPHFSATNYPYGAGEEYNYMSVNVRTARIFLKAHKIDVSKVEKVKFIKLVEEKVDKSREYGRRGYSSVSTLSMDSDSDDEPYTKQARNAKPMKGTGSGDDIVEFVFEGKTVRVPRARMDSVVQEGSSSSSLSEASPPCTPKNTTFAPKRNSRVVAAVNKPAALEERTNSSQPLTRSTKKKREEQVSSSPTHDEGSVAAILFWQHMEECQHDGPLIPAEFGKCHCAIFLAKTGDQRKFVGDIVYNKKKLKKQ